MTRSSAEAALAELASDRTAFRSAGETTPFLTSEPLSPREALALRNRAHPRVLALGWSTVIVDPSAYDFLLTQELLLPEPIDGRSASAQVEAKNLFHELEQELVDNFDDGDDDSLVDQRRAELDAIIAPQPTNDSDQDFHFLEKSDKARVFILPVAEHQVVAALGFGGFNQAPDEHINRVVHAYWHAAHGAVPLYVGGDYIELAVARPPKTLNEMRTLAWQQFVYCSDIVEQGTHTLPALAQELNKHKWFFWWD